MNTDTESPWLRLAEAALLAPRADDRLVLDDACLRGAIEGKHPLTAEQKEQLLNSPLTLRRFKRLITQMNDRVAGWEGSQGLLLAAAEDKPLQVLTTEDGKWALHFLPGRGDEIRLVLNCLDDELRRALQQSSRILEVRDSDGNLLCQGKLDSDHELNVPWRFAAPPREHFMQVGGRFSVSPRKK